MRGFDSFYLKPTCGSIRCKNSLWIAIYSFTILKHFKVYVIQGSQNIEQRFINRCDKKQLIWQSL